MYLLSNREESFQKSIFGLLDICVWKLSLKYVFRFKNIWKAVI